jgi:hypothetical protein
MATIVDRTHVTVPVLAREWGVAPAKIAAFVKAGELRATNIATRADQRPRYMIARADIDDFLARRAVVPDQPATPRVRRRRQSGVTEFF